MAGNHLLRETQVLYGFRFVQIPWSLRLSAYYLPLSLLVYLIGLFLTAR